jgi:hypothetical protein
MAVPGAQTESEIVARLNQVPRNLPSPTEVPPSAHLVALDPHHQGLDRTRSPHVAAGLLARGTSGAGLMPGTQTGTSTKCEPFCLTPGLRVGKLVLEIVATHSRRQGALRPSAKQHSRPVSCRQGLVKIGVSRPVRSLCIDGLRAVKHTENRSTPSMTTISRSRRPALDAASIDQAGVVDLFMNHCSSGCSSPRAPT